MIGDEYDDSGWPIATDGPRPKPRYRIFWIKSDCSPREVKMPDLPNPLQRWDGPKLPTIPMPPRLFYIGCCEVNNLGEIDRLKAIFR